MFKFYHIEKCGGTSLRYILEDYFLRFIDKNNIYFPKKKNDDIKNNDKEVILTHQRFNSSEIKEDDKIFRFTILRNPIDRVISHYYFFDYKIYNMEMIDLSDEEFKNYCNCHGMHMCKCLDLLDENNNIYNDNILKLKINNFNFIAILENLKLDIKILENKLNKFFIKNYNLKILEKNVNSKKNKNSIKEYDILREKVSKHCKNDLKLYYFVKKHNNLKYWKLYYFWSFYNTLKYWKLYYFWSFYNTLKYWSLYYYYFVSDSYKIKKRIKELAIIFLLGYFNFYFIGVFIFYKILNPKRIIRKIKNKFNQYKKENKKKVLVTYSKFCNRFYRNWIHIHCDDLNNFNSMYKNFIDTFNFLGDVITVSYCKGDTLPDYNFTFIKFTNHINFYDIFNNINVNYEKLIFVNKYTFISLDKEVIISEDLIDKLFVSFDKLNCDIMSPLILYQNNIEYFGGFKNEDNIYYINKNDIDNIDGDIKYTRNTQVYFEQLYVSKLSLLKILSQYTNQFVLNIKINPFIVARMKNYQVKDSKPIIPYKCDLDTFREYLKINNKYLKSLIMEEHKTLNFNKNKNVLILEHSILTPDKDCGSKYIYNIINSLLKMNYNVYFFQDNFSRNLNTLSYINDLREKGVYVNYSSYLDNLEDLLRHNFDLFDYIFISRFDKITKYYDIVRKYNIKAKIIFQTHDLNFLRVKRQCEINNIEFDSNLETEEIEMIKKCDQSILTSKYEEKFLIEKYNINRNKLFHLPILFENLEDNFKYDSNNVKDIVFVGSTHTPNIDSINYFLNNIFFKILKFENTINLHIIGNCSKRISYFNTIRYFNNLIFHKNVDEKEMIEIIRNCKLSIVPLLYGAGIKGKVLDSLNFGVPILSSSIGVEGIDVSNNKDIIILDYCKDYESKFIEVYRNNVLLNNISNAGKQLFVSKYSVKNQISDLKNIFKKLDNIEKSNNTEEKKYICILDCIYNWDNSKELLKYFQNLSDSYEYHILLINNNKNLKLTSHENIFIIEGNNYLHEFSGFVEGIEYIRKNNIIKKYSNFIFTNDTVNTNYPITSILNLNRDCFEDVIDNNNVCGLVDSFGKKFILEDISVDNWIRFNFVIIPLSLFNYVKYNILRFDIKNTFYENNELKINIDQELYNNIKSWLNQDRYKLLDNHKKKIKICNILNEYHFTNLIKQNFTKISDLRNLQKYYFNSYNFKFGIICNNNEGGSLKWINNLKKYLEIIQLCSKEQLFDFFLKINNNATIIINSLIYTDIEIDDLIQFKKIFNFKIIIPIHDWYWFIGNNLEYIHNFYLTSKPIKNLKIFNIADKIICPSDFVYNFIIDKVKSEKIIKCKWIDYDNDNKNKSLVEVNKGSKINIGVFVELSNIKGYDQVYFLKNHYQNINFYITGRNIELYKDNYKSFINLVEKYNIHGFLLLNKIGETWCYSLTKILLSNLPLFYNNFGSFRERIPSDEKYFINNNLESEYYNFDALIDNFNKFLNYIQKNNIYLNKLDNPKISNLELLNILNENEYSVVFLITSKIIVSKNKLSYSETRSIYSEEERFNDTLKTIVSIKNYYPYAKIIIIDNSKLSDYKKLIIRENVNIFLDDVYINKIKNIDYFTDISICKGSGEMAMLNLAINYLIKNNLKFKHIFKITGRYELSDDFNKYDYQNNKIIMKKNMNLVKNKISNNYYYTCFYKFNYENCKIIYDITNQFIKNKESIIINNNYKGLEEIFPDLLFNAVGKKNVKIINTLGIKQKLSISKDFNSFYTEEYI